MTPAERPGRRRPPKSEPQPWPFGDSDDDGWPTAEGDETDFKKQLDLAKLEVRKKRTDQEIARQTADEDADLTVEKKYYDSIFEVAKGTIERTRSSADFVQKGAGAIVTIYSAVLGVAFSVSERPLPARGVIPAFFLGLAIVCATYFIAWLPDPDPRAEREAAAGESPRDKFVNAFIGWTSRAALARRKWLRASVVALAGGLVFLPAPFVSFGTSHKAAAATSWPQPEKTAPNANLELRKILYQAQVAQATAAKPAAVSGKHDWIWWMGAGIMLGLVVLLPHATLVSPSSATAIDQQRRQSSA